jgi:hypothetical protein
MKAIKNKQISLGEKTFVIIWDLIFFFIFTF